MNYPLKEYGAFLTYGEEPNLTTYGLMLRCPNCGVAMSAWFSNPIGAAWFRSNAPESKGEIPLLNHDPMWDRTGETLETLSLVPSFLAFDHYHSWIRDGQLWVDSEFSCKPEQVARKWDNDALFERLKKETVR